MSTAAPEFAPVTKTKRGQRPLHLRAARAYATLTRFQRASRAALMAALLGWLLGAALSWHVGVTLLAFVVGFGWHFQEVSRRASQQAFRWIEAETGLSYHTALELPPHTPESFAQALRQKAATINALAAPKLTSYTLPQLLAAALCILLPHALTPQLTSPLAGFTQELTGTIGQSKPPRARAKPEPTALATGAAPTQTGQRAQQGNRQSVQAAGENLVGPTPQSAAEASQQEAQALEQFVAASSGQPGAQDAAAQQATTQTGSANVLKRIAQTTAPQQAEREGRKDKANQSVQGAGQTDTPPVKPNYDLRDTGKKASKSARKNEQATSNGVDILQIRNSAAREKQAINNLLKDGRSSDRAGTGASEDIASSTTKIGSSRAKAEQLQGQRGKGPMTVAGQSLQRGQTPSYLPPADKAGDYKRAAEEIVREGTIPASYQNLVKNYFN